MEESTEELLADFFARRGRLFSNPFDVPEWLKRELIVGYQVELEHGSKLGSKLNVSKNATDTTIKIALAHLKESPDYYDRLQRMEKEADAFWTNNQDEFNKKIAEVDKIINSI
jgi:hypothetical protein